MSQKIFLLPHGKADLKVRYSQDKLLCYIDKVQKMRTKIL